MFKLIVKVAVPLLMAIMGARKVFKARKKKKETKMLETTFECQKQNQTETGSPADQPAHDELFCMGSVAKQRKRKQRLSRTLWNRSSNNNGGHIVGQSKPRGGREVNNNVMEVESSVPVASNTAARPRPETSARPSTKRSRT